MLLNVLPDKNILLVLENVQPGEEASKQALLVVRRMSTPWAQTIKAGLVCCLQRGLHGECFCKKCVSCATATSPMFGSAFLRQGARCCVAGPLQGHCQLTPASPRV